VDDAVADGVDVLQARDAGDLRLGRRHPLDDVRQGCLVVAQRRGPLHGGMVAHLEGDDRLAANPLDEALGQLTVGVAFDELGVCLDDLELE